MLREALSAIGPFLGYCDHPIRFAELILLALLFFILGCCCGGILIGLILSPWIRNIIAKILLHCIEPERGGGLIRGLAGQDRLQRYRG